MTAFTIINSKQYLQQDDLLGILLLNSSDSHWTYNIVSDMPKKSLSWLSSLYLCEHRTSEGWVIYLAFGPTLPIYNSTLAVARVAQLAEQRTRNA